MGEPIYSSLFEEDSSWEDIVGGDIPFPTTITLPRNITQVTTTTVTQKIGANKEYIDLRDRLFYEANKSAIDKFKEAFFRYKVNSEGFNETIRELDYLVKDPIDFEGKQVLNMARDTNTRWVVRSNSTTPIQDAYDSIGDSSATNPYAVMIPPGEWVGETLSLNHPYIHLIGSGIYSTIINTDSPASQLVNITTGANSGIILVQDMTLEVQVDYKPFFNNAGSGITILFKNCRFYNSSSSTTRNYVYKGPDSGANKVFFVDCIFESASSAGTGGILYVLPENIYNNDSCSDTIYVDSCYFKESLFGLMQGTMTAYILNCNRDSTRTSSPTRTIDVRSGCTVYLDGGRWGNPATASHAIGIAGGTGWVANAQFFADENSTSIANVGAGAQGGTLHLVNVLLNGGDSAVACASGTANLYSGTYRKHASGANNDLTQSSTGTINTTPMADFTSKGGTITPIAWGEFPITPSAAPDADYEVANKKFVDDSIAGAGHVVGPASATDTAIVRYDLTTGELVQDSGVLIDDTDNVTIPDGGSLNLQEDITFTGATTENLIKIPDNLADALSVYEGANQYVKIITTDDEEDIILYKPLEIIHTATMADDHSLEMDVNAANLGDVKAIDIDYITGTIADGQDEGIMLININEIAATGGDVFGLEVLATEGSADIYGMKAGAVVGPVHQDSGTFANPTTGTDNTLSTDVAAMIDGNINTTTAIFESNSEYILIGAAAPFEEIEFILTTGASAAGIKPTFAYSTAGSHQFTAFTPVDGTNGLRNTGVVAWDAGDLTAHAVNTDTGTYDIKITRTRTNLGTTPVLGYAKTAATTEYIWDKNGDLSVKSITATGGASSLATNTTIGNLTLANGSITDSGGTISFGDETLSTTGALASGDHTISKTAPILTLNATSVVDGYISFASATKEVRLGLDSNDSDDELLMVGQTASVNTRLLMQAQDGYYAELRLYSGSSAYGYIQIDANDHLKLINTVQDADLVFGINDGGVAKTITWDADVDKIKHSAGLFDFDNDQIKTSGLATFGSLLFGSGGATVTEIKDEDDMTSDSATMLATQQSIKAYVDNKTNVGFKALKSASDQTITTATHTIVVLDSEQWDTGSDFAGNKFTAPIDGKYTFNVQNYWPAANDQKVYTAHIYVNQAAAGVYLWIRQSISGAGGMAVPQCTCTLDLTATDEVEAMAYQDSGGDETLGKAADLTFMDGQKIAD